MNSFWDERYSETEYAYGVEPNNYFKTKIDTLESGKLLLPADGEGRNAVYAASLGWEVDAFDLSEVGRQKAFELAKQKNVKINYSIIDASEFESNKFYDAIAFTFTHFGQTKNNKIYPKLAGMVKKGGYLILECFSINQLQFRSNSGGPADIDVLFTNGDIMQLFPDFKILDLAERLTKLSEGKYHRGTASVINFFGQKI